MTTLRVGASTDTGQVRANNQDAILVAEPVFAVADGMGGHAAGEIASQVAIESLQADDASTLASLKASVGRANRAVWERASQDPDLRGMGTTLCVVALAPAGPGAGGPDDDRILVANVGDSRVYQFHDGEITQVTDDHSLVEDLVREGQLSHEEARSHPQRNILTRVLGNEPEVEVDGWEVIPQHGDRYLLCSDGLFNEVEDERIAAVLRRLADPEDAAHELVALANQHGGRDNVSVVVVDVVDDDGRAAVASAALATAPPTVARESPPTSAVPAAPPAATPTAAPAASWQAGPGSKVTPAAAGKGTESSRRRRVTWRSVVFVFSVLAVLGGSVAAVAWFARSTYHVGLDDEQVVIFRGRPGGLLWLEPTLAERTDVPLAEVPPSRLGAVTAGKEEPSLAAARRYVATLEEQFAAERPTTTTTGATTTSTTSALIGTGSG